MEYRKATIDDLDMLVSTRITVLRAANKLDDNVDMSEVERESRDYYEKALLDESHTAYLVFDDGEFVGAGGVSYFRVMPTYHNPSGRKAYIMNMYTAPDHRRRGIAYNTLDLLVKDARKRALMLFHLRQQIWADHYMRDMAL